MRYPVKVKQLPQNPVNAVKFKSLIISVPKLYQARNKICDFKN